ncbi:MAG: hemolysin family protein [Tannerella sp.]|nr:hemolysin family protein [Tannerella sp.]
MASLFSGSVFSEPVINAVVSFAGISLLLSLLCLIAAGERAVFALSPDEVDGIQEENTATSRYIRHLSERPSQSFFALAIVRALVHVLSVWLCIHALDALLSHSVRPALLCLYILPGWMAAGYIFGGLVPYFIVRNRALPVIRRVALCIRAIDVMLAPITGCAQFPERKAACGESPAVAKEPADEKEMLDEITHFYHKRADEIMVPRLDMEAVDVRCSFPEVKDRLIRTGFSRIPVYDGTEDNIKGILYGKDVLPAAGNPADFQWQSLIRPAYFVPETKKIDHLLEEFRSHRIHIAIVVDEFGCTSGLVTLEDIIEEIVGEIADEYDDDEKLFFRLPDGSYIFEGKIQLNDFFRETDIDPDEFGEMPEEAETLAGLLLEIKGTLPRRRETIEYRNYRFRILEANERRVLKIKFSIVASSEK